MSLGATRQQTYRMVLWQLGLLGTGSALIAIIISLVILPLLPILLKQFLPNGFETQLSPISLMFALVLGGVGSLVFCLPVLSRIRTVEPLHLFHENIQLATQLGGAEVDSASCTCDLAPAGEISFQAASRAFRSAVDTACHVSVAA